MPREHKTAQKGEITAFLTQVIRGEAEGHLPDKIRAADLLGRHLGLWNGQAGEESRVLVISGGDDLTDGEVLTND